MAVRQISVFGDPVLRQPAEPVGDVDDGVRGLVRDLLDTVDAPGHAGLAAPQIGVALCAFSWNVEGDIGYVLDPRITGLSDEQELGDELYLSRLEPEVRRQAMGQVREKVVADAW